MRPTILPDATCPRCGFASEAASGVEGNTRSTPLAGDLVLCFGCGLVMYFGLDLRPVPLPEAQLAALSPETRAELGKIQDLLKLVRPVRATA